MLKNGRGTLVPRPFLSFSGRLGYMTTVIIRINKVI